MGEDNRRGDKVGSHTPVDPKGSADLAVTSDHLAATSDDLVVTIDYWVVTVTAW